MEHYPKNDVWFLLPGHSARLPPEYTGDPRKPPYILGNYGKKLLGDYKLVFLCIYSKDDPKKTEYLLSLDRALSQKRQVVFASWT